MELKKVEVGKSFLTIPRDYQQVQSLKDDPIGSVPFAFQSPEALCFLMIIPITNPLDAMPYDQTQEVIDGIHSCLGKGQGLIEVKSLETASSAKMIYSIVKTAKTEGGVSYTWTCNLTLPLETLSLQGFFEEIGVTGGRDAEVFRLAREKGLLKDQPDGTLSGWMNDPYDPSRTAGRLMNLSEDEEYDALFPHHPLSLLRSFIKTVVSNN